MEAAPVEGIVGELNAILVWVLLQILCVNEAGTTVALIVGSTVTTMFPVGPTQPPVDTGATVYVTVNVPLVELVNLSP